jgi:hypothetical protein
MGNTTNVRPASEFEFDKVITVVWANQGNYIENDCRNSALKAQRQERDLDNI